jgi:LuxR family maltose regulon positive regulatory protein
MAAEKILQEANSLAVTWCDAQLDAVIAGYWARLRCFQGKFQEAEAYLQQVILNQNQFSRLRQRQYFIWQAQIKIHVTRDQSDHQKIQATLDSLDGVLAEAQSEDMHGDVLKVLVLQAVGLQAVGRNTGAQNTLKEALALAAPQKYLQVFIDEGQPMARMLYQAVEDGITSEFAKTLLARFPIQTRSGQFANISAVEPLTTRELEVLRWIATGATNHEIAQELTITLNTTKKHVSHLIHKLGVTNRRQAVRRGKELGLV